MTPAITVAASVDNIFGGLAAAVSGDSLGTATENMSRRRVLETYGRLEDFADPKHSPFAGGRRIGELTDDSSMILALCELFTAHQRISVDDVVAMLLAWGKDPEMRERFAGPTTRRALVRLEAGEDPALVGRGEPHNGTGVSNGGAMKVAPAGWLNPGDVEGAVRDAQIMCLPTHNTQIAISGAGAIAAGVAYATPGGGTLDGLVDACVQGARLGERLGIESGREAPGASIPRRIEFGVSLARAAEDVWQAVDQISALVGAGLATTEAVPAAVSVVVAAQGDPKLAILAAANLGDDTDTVACMAGALAGTLSGSAALPERWIDLVSETNNLDLPALAERIAHTAAHRVDRV